MRPTVLGLLAALAVGLAGWCYFTGEAATLPLCLLPKLTEVPLTLEQLHLGTVVLPVRVSGFVVSLTHDVGGPFTQEWAAGAFLVLLALGLAGWLAVVSTLERYPFVAGMVPVIFLLMSLNTDTLGIFAENDRYFLYLTLGVLGGAAFGVHAFAENLALRWRWLLFGAQVAGLSGLLFFKSEYSILETTLQLAAYATTGGAVLIGLLVLFVSVENIRALLWFNTQAAEPGSRFGLGPFLAASLLYLGALLALVWNGELRLWPGLSLDPLVLLLPALLSAGLGLRLRAATYRDYVPYSAARQLYPLLVLVAAAELAYALATANTPLLTATRYFTGLALLSLGAAFLLYVLMNFMPLIRQRLQVHRVVFEPRRLPFYMVYLVGIGAILAVQFRDRWPLAQFVEAGMYNHLGDLTRLQSETYPDDLGLGLLAERYYAESGDVLDRNNDRAQFGRAALYRFRDQRQSEIVVLRHALLPQPNEKVSLRLGSLFLAPQDLFDGLDVLRRGLRDNPRSAPLAGDLAQLFTQTALTDSVAYYMDKAERLAPGSYSSRTNQLAFLLQQKLLPAAAKLSASFHPKPQEPALASNLTLLQLLQNAPAPPATAADFSGITDLDAAGFAAVYHAALAASQRHSNAFLPTLARLNARPANAPYYEQLLFLQALTHHAIGQEQAARHLLAPLTAGTSASATYYRQLLALWQAQQGQYRTAAEQLARATAPDSTLLATLQALARQQPAPARPPVGTDWLTQARQAEAQNPATAQKLYQRLIHEAPFNEIATLAAADFFTRRHDYPAAYEALQAGLAENPSSPALLQAYVLAAADSGLPDYAAETLTELQKELPAADFARLQAAYAARRAAHAAAAASFGQ